MGNSTKVGPKYKSVQHKLEKGFNYNMLHQLAKNKHATAQEQRLDEDFLADHVSENTHDVQTCHSEITLGDFITQGARFNQDDFSLIGSQVTEEWSQIEMWETYFSLTETETEVSDDIDIGNDNMPNPETDEDGFIDEWEALSIGSYHLKK